MTPDTAARQKQDNARDAEAVAGLYAKEDSDRGFLARQMLALLSELATARQEAAESNEHEVALARDVEKLSSDLADTQAELATARQKREKWWAQKHEDEQRAAMRMVERVEAELATARQENEAWDERWTKVTDKLDAVEEEVQRLHEVVRAERRVVSEKVMELAKVRADLEELGWST